MNNRHFFVSKRVLVSLLFTVLLIIVLPRAGRGQPLADHLDQHVTTTERRHASPQRRWRGRPESGVYKAQVNPHWFANGSRFWYRNDLAGNTKEFIVVDAAAGNRRPAFDHEKLAASLSAQTSESYAPQQLPFDELEFTDDGQAIRFTLQGARWTCDLTSYECSTAEDDDAAGDGEVTDAANAPAETDRRPYRRRPWGRRPGAVGPSPDGKWTAQVRDGNLFLKSTEDDQEVRLSQDGTPEVGYGMLAWSPDAHALVAFRIQPGDRKEVYLIESSPADGGRAVLHRRPYPLPGDKYDEYELNLFQLADRQQIKPPVEKVDFGRPRLRWKPDGRHFAYVKVDRGHQRFRVIDVDSHTGESFSIIDETTDTFIWTAHNENLALDLVNWLEQSEEIIYASERDGWRHLYLVDTKDGGIQQITQGPYVVRGMDRIDEERRQIWFRASGNNSDQDPYLMHYYRIDFDGTNLVALTKGNGNHAIQYSPDRQYLIDTYSRVDMPPVHELRRVTDGQLICQFEKADITELEAGGWKPLEVFVAKGRDDATDIWGVICRPRDFDPSRKYPIIESIYAGPQGSYVPKSFRAGSRHSELADLGFIVVQIDGMGTANRSKTFHDVCWHNLKDAGLPDRVLWIKAAARKYAYLDTSRVGVYGNSAGGQNATGAVLFHPEFYKVAVSSCGCHDNRMDKASWNEQWMGYPVGPQYSLCSNIDNAHRLQGKLLLIVGEMDDNVPPESTLRLADALIKADKDFDLLVIPGGGHGMGGAYGARRMREFFQRHL